MFLFFIILSQESEIDIKSLEVKKFRNFAKVVQYYNIKFFIIDGLLLLYSFFPPKRLNVKTPLQSIGRYPKLTFNSFSGHI